MQIIPLNDRIVIFRQEEKEMVKNGLFIPENAVEKPQEGLVVAVGSGKVVNNVFVPLDVKVGDKILFGKFSGTEVVVDDVKLLILREEEVFAKLVPGEKK
jgi:chaperonin GroES